MLPSNSSISWEGEKNVISTTVIRIFQTDFSTQWHFPFPFHFKFLQKFYSFHFESESFIPFYVTCKSSTLVLESVIGYTLRWRWSFQFDPLESNKGVKANALFSNKSHIYEVTFFFFRRVELNRQTWLAHTIPLKYNISMHGSTNTDNWPSEQSKE